MELDSFITSAVVLLVAASLTVTLFKQLGMGSVLGLLVAGIIVGPFTPGPGITTHVEDLREFTELGVVLLLFLIGLEIRPERLWRLRREVLGLGSLQIVVSGLAIAAYFALNHLAWKTAVLIGLTLALSSTAFVMQLLQDRGEIASSHGTTALSVLLMQDLAVVPLLAVVPILSDVGTLSAEMPRWEQFAVVLGLFVGLWGFGRYLVPFALERLARESNREGFLLVATLAVFLAAWATHEAGLSMALGAFLMGMLLSGSHYNLQLQAYIEPYKRLLISIFFVAVGMSIDVGRIAEQPLLFAQHAAAVILIKIVVMFLLGAAFGLPRNVNTRLSLMLAQGGEFGFVLVGSAKVLQVIDDATFVLTIGIISISMLMTTVLVRLGDHFARRIERSPTGAGTVVQPLSSASPARVIVGGYGRVGHIVSTLLQKSGVPFIVIDNDPVRVAKSNADGFPAYFGDIADPELLSAAHAGQASLVVLSVDQLDTALRAISHIKSTYPQVPVIARARDLQASGRLLEAGAAQAFPEVIESSLRLAANAIEMVGVAQEDVDLLLEDVRATRYALVRDATEDARR